MKTSMCSICQKVFVSDDEMRFVCDGCLSALTCPACGSSDVLFDWSLTELSVVECYFWVFICRVCGYENDSPSVSLGMHDESGREFYRELKGDDK